MTTYLITLASGRTIRVQADFATIALLKTMAAETERIAEWRIGE